MDGAVHCHADRRTGRVSRRRLVSQKIRKIVGRVEALAGLRGDVHLERTLMNYTYMETPIGTLLIAGDEKAVRRIDFPKEGEARIAEADWTESKRGPVGEAVKQLREYFAGKRA